MVQGFSQPKQDFNETRWFFVLLSLHVVTWTLVPTLLNLNLRVDVLEGVFWGHEWQLGYYKHPPLSAWLLESTVTLLGRHDFATYLLAQSALAVAFVAVWTLSRDLVRDGRARLVAVFLLEWIPYYNVVSVEFDPNTVMPPCWALTVLFFWRALRRGNLAYWVLVGCFGALSLYGKYESIVLLVSMLLFSLVDSFSRKRWRTPGPYVAVAVCVLGSAPHLVWMVETGFLPVTYAIGRAAGGGKSVGLLPHLANPVRFFVEQLLVALPFLAFYAYCRIRRPARPVVASAEDGGPDPLAFLSAVCLGPFAIFAGISLLMGWRILILWGVPLFLFVPLYCLIRWPLDLRTGLRGAWVWAAIGVFAVYPAGYALATPYIERMGFPGRALSAEVLARWKEAFPGRPIAYVIGSEKYQGWVPGNVAYYLPQRERPSVWLEFDPKYTPWMRPAELRQKGGVVLWSGGSEPPRWATRFAYSPRDVHGEIRLLELRKRKRRELMYHLVLVAPEAPGPPSPLP